MTPTWARYLDEARVLSENVMDVSAAVGLAQELSAKADALVGAVETGDSGALRELASEIVMDVAELNAALSPEVMVRIGGGRSSSLRRAPA